MAGRGLKVPVMGSAAAKNTSQSRVAELGAFVQGKAPLTPRGRCLRCRSMKTTVQRWGNSLALRIPRAYAIETKIRDGSEVELSMKGGALVVRPIRPRRHSLARLLAQVTPENLHREEPTGKAVGQEVW
jgi:antitoxin MazE